MRSRGLLAVVACGVLAAGTVVGGGSAGAATAPPESLTMLFSHTVHVTSSTGRHLLLKVNAVRHSDSATTSDRNSPGTLSIVLSSKSKVESHTWEFPISAGTFATTLRGNGSLKTGTQLAPFGKVD